MQEINSQELEYVKRTLASGSRLDLRGLQENRSMIYRQNNIPRADRSLYMKLGSTELELSVLFKSTRETLEHMNLVLDNSNIQDDSETIDFICTKIDGSPFQIKDFNKSNIVYKKIENIVKSLKIGVLIEVKVLFDDGNVFDLFFAGLHAIFFEVNAPNIKNLQEDIKISESLPLSRSYAIFNDIVLSDPTLLEEKAADGIVRILFDQNKRYITSTEKPMDYDVLKNLLNSSLDQKNLI